MKRLVLLASYFLATPLFIFLLIFYQIYLHRATFEQPPVLGVSSVAAHELPIIVPDERNAKLVSSERQAKVETLERFFARYDSPLLTVADEIVDNADTYGLDYRLLPAIAMQESTLCLKAPEGLNNCWGFGIYGKKKTAFPSLADAVETISRTIARDYHAKGLIEPDEIMSKYTPSNAGEWAENVTYVMDRIEPSL